MGHAVILTRPFNATGQEVSAVRLGGEGSLRNHGKTSQARAVVQKAVAQGVTYFDSARVYADSEVYYGSVWREFPDVRPRIFQASKKAAVRVGLRPCL